MQDFRQEVTNFTRVFLHALDRFSFAYRAYEFSTSRFIYTNACAPQAYSPNGKASTLCYISRYPKSSFQPEPTFNMHRLTDVAQHPDFKCKYKSPNRPKRAYNRMAEARQRARELVRFFLIRMRTRISYVRDVRDEFRKKRRNKKRQNEKLLYFDDLAKCQHFSPRDFPLVNLQNARERKRNSYIESAFFYRSTATLISHGKRVRRTAESTLFSISVLF